MILGIGIDYLETSRVERELSHGEWLPRDGIFTPEEIHDCAAARKPARRFAACFTAKEATMKALGVRASDLGMFREVEVKRENNQGYRVVLHDRMKDESMRLRVKSIKLCITHSAHDTGAVVILED